MKKNELQKSHATVSLSLEVFTQDSMCEISVSAKIYDQNFSPDMESLGSSVKGVQFSACLTHMQSPDISPVNFC